MPLPTKDKVAKACKVVGEGHMNKHKYTEAKDTMREICLAYVGETLVEKGQYELKPVVKWARVHGFNTIGLCGLLHVLTGWDNAQCMKYLGEVEGGAF